MVQVERRGRGRPMTGAKQDTRKDILLAAIDQFGRRGFEGVSLNQIASAAKTDIGLIRYYFGAKIDLWKAVVDHIAAQLEVGIEPITNGAATTDAERLKAAIRWFVDISARWPQISRMIVFDGNDDSARARYIARKWVRPFYAYMEGLIRGAQAEGALPDVAIRTTFFLIAHGGSFPMALPELTNKFPGGDIASAEALRDHADSIITSLFANQMA